MLVRDRAKTEYDIALVSTDLHATAAQIVERYAARWSTEVAIEDAKHNVGVGQARNRTRRAVERTVPSGLVAGTLAICWYATAGHHPDDVQAARDHASRYRHKAQPSILDMLIKLRQVVIAAQLRPTDPTPSRPHPQKSTSSARPGLGGRNCIVAKSSGSAGLGNAPSSAYFEGVSQSSTVRRFSRPRAPESRHYSLRHRRSAALENP